MGHKDRTINITIYTYLQNKKDAAVRGAPPPPPPPIIFERLKLPQQIIYRRKENLSESPNQSLKEFEIFSNFQKWPKFRLFRENCS